MTVQRQARHCRCGARLASDRVGGHCHSCERDRASFSTAPDVPLEFWTTSALRQALAARHMGRVVQAYRHHPWHGGKVPQARLAGWLSTTQAQISRAESGPPLQDLDTLVHWARVLRVPAQHLWFALPRETQWGPNAATPTPAIEAGMLAPSLDLSAIHVMAQAFRLADRQSGGGHLYRTVQHYLQVEVGPELVTLRSGRDSAAAFSAAASLTEMIGWMAHDSGNDVLAADHFSQALRLAGAADDFVLQGNILASMSHLANALGRSSEAVTQARAGLDRLARASCHSVISRLHALEARGQAGLGDSLACREALNRAEETLCRPLGEISEWASPFDEGSLASEAATAMHALGQLSEAARQAGRVLELRQPDRARSRAFSQLTLAAVHLDQGDVDAAALLGAEILSTSSSVQSSRVRGQLLNLGRRLHRHRRTASASRFLGALNQGAVLAPSRRLRKADDR